MVSCSSFLQAVQALGKAIHLLLHASRLLTFLSMGILLAYIYGFGFFLPLIADLPVPAVSSYRLLPMIHSSPVSCFLRAMHFSLPDPTYFLDCAFQIMPRDRVDTAGSLCRCPFHRRVDFLLQQAHILGTVTQVLQNVLQMDEREILHLSHSAPVMIILIRLPVVQKRLTSLNKWERRLGKGDQNKGHRIGLGTGVTRIQLKWN